jgi:RNA polymerase-binding transcription factor DksA
MAVKNLNPADALAQKANEAEHLREFIDRTTFSGDQREVAGELSAVDQHPADVADLTMQREVDYTIKGIVEEEVHHIQQALKRQAEGRYGICDDCGQQIDPERLAVRPQATLCIICQRRLEESPRGR